MKLDVPVLRQPEGSVDCGIVGIQMIMAYHGLDIPFSQLKADLVVDKVGTYMPQLGSYLIRKGFEVTIVNFNPWLFSMKHRLMPLQEVKAHFESLLSNKKFLSFHPRNEKAINYFLGFLSLGGNFIVDIPNKDYVEQELVNGRPAGALLTSNVLSTNPNPVFNFHFNIIKGLSGDRIIVNDPLWDERGGEKSYNVNDFFYALHASAYGDIDNASLLLVKKK